VKASMICKAGSYSAGYSLDPCYPCREGYTTALEGTRSSSDCKVSPWFYLEERSGNVPLPCGEGEFCEGFEATIPQDCPPGTWSAAGAKSIDGCESKWV
jgi:hypothetical protein